jgi:multidrug resistance efflux pump
MSPDQKFARLIKYAIALFILLFGYFVIADIAIPLTPQAMATRVVTKVSSRVSGQISHVYITNNQHVRQGDKLFQIDPAPYLLAVEKAQLALEQTFLANQQLDAEILAAKADVKSSEISAIQKQRDANHLDTLFAHSGTSKQQRDDAISTATVAQVNSMAATARLQQLIVRRGNLGNDNINVRVATNQLKQAQLNLSYTDVTAEKAGTITNLQLESGSYATAGTPLVALVDNNIDIIADFREKSLLNFGSHSHALVAFDGEPGKIFSASINSLDAGVSNGQFDANGRLAAPSESNRWVRDAQRMRLHLTISDTVQLHLPTGARATVQLVPNNIITAWLARGQIHLLSWLHFIY